MNLDTSSGIVILIIIFLLLLIFFSFLNWYIEFSKELRYLNIEIKRCIGREKLYYKKKRRKLFLSILPFVKYEP